MQGIIITLRVQGSMSIYLMCKDRQIKTVHFSLSGFVNRWTMRHFFLLLEISIRLFKTSLDKDLNSPSWRTPTEKVLQLPLEFRLLSHEGPDVFSVHSGPEVVISKFSLQPRNDSDLETWEEVIEIGLELWPDFV